MTRPALSIVPDITPPPEPEATTAIENQPPSPKPQASSGRKNSKNKTHSAGKKAKTLDFIMVTAFWGGLLAACLALVCLMVLSLNKPQAAIYLVMGTITITTFILVGAGMKAYAPILLEGLRPRKSLMLTPASGNAEEPTIEGARTGGLTGDLAGGFAGGLAGGEVLASGNLGGKIIAADRDARLITRRDGVVAFANTAYQQLATDAGVPGNAGLPPRIERLFAQQGAEAMKIFRLCRAARSGDRANEDIYQMIGFGSNARRRRFDVSVSPIDGDDAHTAWVLRELPADEEEHDHLATAYADYLRPVFALERSGQIAWSNAAMREKLGAAKGSLLHIDDVILGETGSIVEGLWASPADNQHASVRRQHDTPLEADFTPFCHGGSGEGFVCVEMDFVEPDVETEEVSLAGEIADAPFGVAIVQGEFGRDAKFTETNKAFTDVFGDGKKALSVSKAFSPETINELAREAKRKSPTGTHSHIIEAQKGEGPTARTFALYVKPVNRRRGSYGTKRTLIYSVEITERKRMELDYGQDQKLKAIGNLAGEVAHDFNNFLQTILGNCELLMMNHPVGDPSYDQLVVIRENSQRLANLTKQLLAFSRKQTMQRKTLSLTELLRDFTKFLDRAVGDKVKLELINGRGLQPVKVDQNQLESAIMNLAVNARDAMGQAGGTLTIRTAHVSEADILENGWPGLVQQDHAMIEISDTGPGVPEEIANQIFDPFFTTKDIGKGTGLGLSTVHGVIGQMGGAIFLDSKPGQGATFRIFLPVTAPDQAPVEPDQPATFEVADLTGRGSILVVEDEDAVRNFVVTALKGRGYTIEEACDGTDALDILEDVGADQFDLIISDVMMMEMDGPVFVRQAREKYDHHPRVIFMSGYAETAMRDQIDDFENAGYLQKPFPAKDLAQVVKDTIGTPSNKSL